MSRSPLPPLLRLVVRQVVQDGGHPAPAHNDPERGVLYLLGPEDHGGAQHPHVHQADVLGFGDSHEGSLPCR